MPLTLNNLPGHQPKVTLLVVTDGRADYLERTWSSVQQNLQWSWHQVVVVDDSADVNNWAHVQTLIKPDVYLGHEFKMGGAQAVRTAWNYLRDSDCDYVFHLEDDWVFPEPVSIPDLIDCLDHPNIANVVLRRDPAHLEGPDGYIGEDPSAFTERSTSMVHTKGFWLNPGVYPREITEREWPEHGHEHHFTSQLIDDGYCFAVYGTKHDPPRAVHIGEHRSIRWTW